MRRVRLHGPTYQLHPSDGVLRGLQKQDTVSRQRVPGQFMLWELARG